MHTAEPVAAFIMRISLAVIPPKDTSIERCNVNIATQAWEKEIFLRAMSFGERSFLDFIRLTVAIVILVKA